jgi:eukaryotic-like serine/threonine-protein kinase
MDGVAVDPVDPGISRQETRAAVAAVKRLGERVSAPASMSASLPPELLGEAAWRLGWVGLLYSGALLLGYFGRRGLLVWSGVLEGSWRAGDVITVFAILMGIAVYLVSRHSELPAARVVDLGLMFQVAGAFGIAAGGYWSGAPPPSVPALTMVPSECVWIIVYPLVVPNAPNKVLVASLLAASMRPAVLAVSAALSAAAITEPVTVASFVLSDYLAALVAYAVARIVHRVNVRLKHAREIGSYELLDRIGEGGMGEVWHARHRLLARPAALKLIRGEVLGSSQRAREAILRRFELEARDTARLGSIHTVDIYDFGTTEAGDFYYVMELLDGISLERFVELFGPMEPARTVHLIAQVCHSLDEAHALGLVHRDIKPANIFMCRLGPDFDFVKVLDFGLVKHLDSRAARGLTVEGTTAGTPAYMAPEVALGRSDADGRADLYSLGCVAYFMLTGQLVFSGDSAVATALAHVNEQPPPPSARSEFQIPPELDALIVQCLAKNPSARPATASDLACRLAAAMPPDGWDMDAARAWWELHKVSLARVEGAPPSAVPSSSARHCWPRLDQRPLPQHTA